jgi:uncharacterized protein YprB with RNaseH-like and TPR domain
VAKELPKCIHRHTPATHPNCFPKYWYEELGHRVGYLDIEANGLKANQNRMLSWAIKERNGDVKFDNVRPEEIFNKPGEVNLNFDKRIVRSLLDEMKEYTVVVGYYSTGFDIPFIRTRAMGYNMNFPTYGTLLHIDVYYQVRSKMSLSRKSLAQATEFLEITGKTHLDFSYWSLAGMGDVKAMKELIHHNVEDVKILEDLHKRLEPYCKTIKKSV